jgi:hypothetical protein
MSTESLTKVRDDFRRAFQEYLEEGDRMAELLRSGGDNVNDDLRTAIRQQQVALTSALERYEKARRLYVQTVMGQLAGLTAMGLGLQ